MCILKSHWQFTRHSPFGLPVLVSTKFIPPNLHVNASSRAVRVFPIPGSPTSMTSRPRPDMASLSAVSNTAISCWRPTKTWSVSLVGPGLCHACEFLEEVDLGPFVWVWGNVTSEVTGCPAGNQSHNQRTSVGRRSRKGVQCTVTGWGCKVRGTERTWFRRIRIEREDTVTEVPGAQSAYRFSFDALPTTTM